MLQRPQPPLLELAFYFQGIRDVDALAKVANVLFQNGASFLGQVGVCIGTNIRQTRFADPFWGGNSESREANKQSLEKLLSDSNTRVCEIFLTNGTLVAPGEVEVLTFSAISDEASIDDQHPIAIVASSERLWPEQFYPPEEINPNERPEDVGQRVYRQFIKLATALQPAYGSILCEYSLECLSDLKRDSRSLAFRDFVINRDFAGKDLMQGIKGASSQMYQEDLGTLVFFSATALFNPKAVNLDSNDSGFLSSQIGELIASRCDGPPNL